MSDETSKREEYRKMIEENLQKYGRNSGEPDKESGRGIGFDDKQIDSFFNLDKTAIYFQFSIQGHQTADFTLSIKAAYFLMRMIDERLEELGKAERKTP